MKNKEKIFQLLMHKLRARLNSIIGFTELLQKETYGSLTKEQKEFLEIIHRNAKELLNLLEEIAQKGNIHGSNSC